MRRSSSVRRAWTSSSELACQDYKLTNRSLRPLFLSLWPGNQHEVKKLRKMREDLANEISELVDEFGPKMFENFDKARMLPSASTKKNQHVEPSMLSHPINWLDERIFGWRRNSVQAEAWADGSFDQNRSPRSVPSTAPGSPHESDLEDAEDVDYDDILAVIDHRGGKSPRRRTRAGRSYSDLRTQPLSPLAGDGGLASPGPSSPLLTVPGEEEGLHHRRAYRANIDSHGEPAAEPAAESPNGRGAEAPAGALGLDKGE